MLGRRAQPREEGGGPEQGCTLTPLFGGGVAICLPDTPGRPRELPHSPSAGASDTGLGWPFCRISSIFPGSQAVGSPASDTSTVCRAPRPYPGRPARSIR